VAIACASHEARPEQLALVRSLLARSASGVDDLECGPENRSRLRHNCSGKHAGMLLACARRGWTRAGYRLPEHPLQRELAAMVAQVTGSKASEILTASDGCAVVTFGISLTAMAAAYSRLGELEAAERILHAMRSYPELVGGPDAVDTRLMTLRTGVVAKRGAEGLLCGRTADGAGFALKAEDGAQRPLLPAAGRLLGVEEALEAEVMNSRGEWVGRLLAR
jgi:L-asparaginase